MKAFFRTWFTGYYQPLAFAEALRTAPAPHWGLLAVIMRSALDALLIYLPAALLGRQPSMPSYLTFAPTERYFAFAAAVTLPVFLAQWLVGGGATHVILRLLKRRSDADLILSFTGLQSLVVGAFLVVWDWGWILLGSTDYNALGISHLVIDLWWVTLNVTCCKRLLDVPVPLGIALSMVGILLGIPFGILFMRAPI
ncbi:MAG: hypothetical protein JXB15_08965 [Anaerolineales bacterium]|nr:hypothetical protein [Anaerolineales bacterium]